ncbi:MAG TPA: TonB-dependent receptor [Granulicella sp.]
MLKCFSTLWVLFFLSASLMAQTSGTIVGTVRDQSGAQVEGAQITVTNLDRNTNQTLTTDSSGSYVAPFLPPGNYQVVALKDGFQKQQSSSIKLDVDARTRMDFTLTVGNVAETVEVTSSLPLLRSETAELGDVIDQKPIQTLPLNGRDFAQLVLLVPGVSPGMQGENLSGNSTNNPRASSAFNALGSQGSANGWLVDGIMDNEYTFNTVMVQPSVESISEFKVLTGVYSAEYGRGAGIVTTQTRSGTKAFHGEAFEYHRNSFVDARSYFNTYPAPKPNHIRNQFGAALGGPLWKDKAFFFLDYYGQTEIQGSTFISTVPTPLEKTGDFVDLNNAGVTIYDPYSTTTANGVTTRTPLPRGGDGGQVVPAAYRNTIGFRIANLYPDPNYSANGGAPGLINNYRDTLKNTTNDNGGNVRVDAQFNQKDSAFVRYSYERFDQFAAKGQGGCCIRTPPAAAAMYELGPYISGGQNTLLLAHGMAISETHIFTPNVINQYLMGYAHTNPDSHQSDFGINAATSLGINGINVSQDTSGLPTITIAGAGNGTNYTTINDGPSFIPVRARQTSYQFGDDLSITHGNHSFKAGYRFIDTIASPYTGLTYRGSLNFATNLTTNPVSASGGSGLASMEMGLFANNNSSPGARGFLLAPYVIDTYEHAAYIQDDWKASPRLSLNLGLRWDLFTPYTEQKGRITNIDLNALTLVYPGVNGASASTNLKTRYNNFGPRIGFSLDLTGNAKTFVRGGYAISYFPEQGGESSMLGLQLPWAISQNMPTIPQYPTAAQLATLEQPLSQPFATPTIVKPMTTAQLIAANPSINGYNTDNQTPSFQTFTLNVEHQFFHDFLLEVAYAGSRSVHSEHCINPQEVQPGPSSVPAANRITIPGIASIRSITFCDNNSYSNYNGFDAKLTRRFSGGYSLMVAYTWSKSLDAGAAAGDHGGAVGDPQTITNMPAGYGPSGFNVPQRLVVNWLWELPFGKRRAYLNHGLVAAVVGGWEFNGIATVQSGLPFTIGNFSGTCPNGATNCWPDRVASTKPAHQTYANWYNPAAYAVPCQVGNAANGSCAVPAYRYGANGRGTLRGPQTTNFDLSAARNFTLPEHITLALRVDAFDAFNRPPMGFPNQSINPNNPAGTSTAITTTYADNRDLQGSIKLTF